MNCQFLGTVHATGPNHPAIYHCLNGEVICTLLQSTRKRKGQPITACSMCTKGTVIAPSPITCVHRGSPTGTKISCQCGVDKELYACALHGACLKRLPPGKQKGRFPELEKAAVCHDCKDFA